MLLVTRNFPPLRGGMERLNLRMLEGLSRRRTVYLVGPGGCGRFAPFAASVDEVSAGPARFLAGAALASLRRALRARPGIVLAGSGLAAPLAWLAARVTGATCLVYLHGLDVVAASRIYQSCWLPFIRKADACIANSRNTRDAAIARGVDPSRIHVVHPGTDLRSGGPQAGPGFRTRHLLEGHPLLLSVGRLTPRKGLVDFVRRVLPRVLAARPDTLFLVIGGDANDAVGGKAGSERERIRAAARLAGVEQALRWLPHCDDVELSAAYDAADVHVFPVVDAPGDVEGFGMVAIEAAAHGLPTVAYDVGGVADAIDPACSGSLVPAGDVDAFCAETCRWLDAGRQARDACRAHAARYAWECFDERLHAVLAGA